MRRLTQPSIDLIFHRTDGAASPFDAALREVVESTPHPCLASPYIGLQYLRSLIGGKPFRLVTDLDEWLRSSPRQIPSILTFLEESPGSVRHLAGLHAKVAVGVSKAFLGSANFTRAGLSLRDEMSVLIRDPKSVDQLVEWFDGLWMRAARLDLAELQEAAARIEQSRPAGPTTPRLRNTGARIRAALKIPTPQKPHPAAASPTAAPVKENHPSASAFSYRGMRRGLFSAVVGNLIASSDPEPKYKKLIAAMQGELARGATFRDLLRAARKADSWISARELIRDIEKHDVSGGRVLDGTIAGDVIRVCKKWFSVDAAKDYLGAIDGYLAWLTGCLSPDDYLTLPAVDHAESLNVSPELARQLIDQLVSLGFVAVDEEGKGVLTGEALWGTIPTRLPRFAAAWGRQGLTFDAPISATYAGGEEKEDFEEFLMAVVDALAAGPCSRSAAQWPPNRNGNVARHLYSTDNRAFLHELLHSNLVRVLLDDGRGGGVVVLNTEAEVAADLEEAGLHRTAGKVRAAARALSA